MFRNFIELFLQDNQKPDWKQKVKLEVDAIKHKLAVEIKNIFYAK
jgi:hypothetical protein